MQASFSVLDYYYLLYNCTILDSSSTAYVVNNKQLIVLGLFKPAKDLDPIYAST